MILCIYVCINTYYICTTHAHTHTQYGCMNKGTNMGLDVAKKKVAFIQSLSCVSCYNYIALSNHLNGTR